MPCSRILCLLLAVLMSSLAMASDGDSVVVQGMFESMYGKPTAEKRRIIRQITLFPASPELQQQLILPSLAFMMLDPQEDEGVRREAIKALFELSRDKRLTRPFVTLLQNESISVAATVEAAIQSNGAFFFPPLVNLSRIKSSDESFRQHVLQGALDLWSAERCDAEWSWVDKEIDPTGKDAPEKHLFDALKQKNSNSATAAVTARRLLETFAARPNPPSSPVRQLRAQLALGCIGEKKFIPRLINRFPSEMENQRGIIAGFLGAYGDPSAVAPLAVFARRDPMRTVRYQALSALVAIANRERPDKERRALTKELFLRFQEIYLGAPSADEKRDVARFGMRLPEGSALIQRLHATERDRKLRDYLNMLLHKQGPEPEGVNPFGKFTPPRSGP